MQARTRVASLRSRACSLLQGARSRRRCVRLGLTYGETGCASGARLGDSMPEKECLVCLAAVLRRLHPEGVYYNRIMFISNDCGKVKVAESGLGSACVIHLSSAVIGTRGVGVKLSACRSEVHLVNVKHPMVADMVRQAPATVVLHTRRRHPRSPAAGPAILVQTGFPTCPACGQVASSLGGYFNGDLPLLPSQVSDVLMPVDQVRLAAEAGDLNLDRILDVVSDADEACLLACLWTELGVVLLPAVSLPQAATRMRVLYDVAAFP